MSKQLRIFAILFFVLFSFQDVSAKVFRNSYVSFILPPRWDCVLENTEWVCRSKDKRKAQQAIIILTAKELGPTDSLSQYVTLLKQPRKVPNSKGKPVDSIVNFVKTRKVSNHTWVDARHLGSELTNYYTRYLATTKQNIAILVTFSAHRKHFTLYSQDFFRAVKSLQVIATGSLADTGTSELRPGSETLGGAIPGAIPGDMFVDEDEDFLEVENSGEGNSDILLGFGILLAGLGVYIILKKKKIS